MYKLVWSAKTESWIVYHQKGQRLCFPMVTYGSFDKHTGPFTVHSWSKMGYRQFHLYKDPHTV